jgi:hypothetical protein
MVDSGFSLVSEISEILGISLLFAAQPNKLTAVNANIINSINIINIKKAKLKNLFWILIIYIHP